MTGPVEAERVETPRPARQGGSSRATARLRNPTLNLALNLTLREIRSEYNRTALGRLWSLLNPLATIAIFAVIFGLLFNAQPHEGANSHLRSYALWVACGIIPWNFLSGGIMSGMGALVANTGLLTKVWFPRWVLVASSVASRTSTFLIELAVLAIIMAIFGGPLVLAYVPLLVPLVALNAVFVLGLSLLLSVTVVYFRDMQHLWTVFNQVWFYASGVVFAADQVRGAEEHLAAEGITLAGHAIRIMPVFEANPAHQFLEAYRAVLYDFTFPSWGTWLQLIAWSAATLLAGALVFRRYSGRIVEEL